MQIEQNQEAIWALGLMSGTSLDGVDAALIKTDGETIEAFGPWITLPMPEGLRELLRSAMYGQGDILSLEHDVTLLHAKAVMELLENIPPEITPQLIGFHGQTIAHRPKEGLTWQIGNGALLSAQTGLDVVCDFRRADMAAGGQGAPLVPLFHAAVAHAQPKPIAMLNIGGVANVTLVKGVEFGVSGFDSNSKLHTQNSILSFDTGPGNVMLNEWCLMKSDKPYDKDGALAAAGEVHVHLVRQFLEDEYFSKVPPKSLDRNHFSLKSFMRLSAEDGAATLTACMAASVAAALAHFPDMPKAWYVCGGGRHNPVMMRMLRERLGEVQPVEKIGLQGDAMEAQAFAYLAVRSIRGLPLTLPSTTGCRKPASGGAVYKVY